MHMIFLVHSVFSEVHAIDVSEYEGADLIYDLNLSLPELLNEQFDYVVDNGTLEHVFCATEAVKNAARICKKGGWIVNVTPAAGYTNHGFYSFSPRFYNDFYENNGFWIDEIQFEFLFDGEGLPNWQMISSQDCRLFSGTDWKRMEDYIDRVRKVDGIGRVLMWVTAQRKEIKGVQFGNPQQAFDNEPEDETVVQRKSYRLETVIEFIKEQEQCILYCAGEVCKQILHAIYDNNLESKILYILDKDFNKTGTRLKNFEVRYPNNASIGCGKPILICSDVYDQEIYDEICTKYPNSKNDLIKICDLM